MTFCNVLFLRTVTVCSLSLPMFSRRLNSLVLAGLMFSYTFSWPALTTRYAFVSDVRPCVVRPVVIGLSKNARAFLPCDAMHTAAIAVTRCPSVCPSRSWVAPKRIKISSKFFSPSGSQAILVFPYQTGWRYSDGNPPNGGIECKGVWKNDDFRPISRFISETVIVRWAHAARQFVSIEFPFHPYNI